MSWSITTDIGRTGDPAYDQFGFDTVDNSPLSESWRSAPGTPIWQWIVKGQSQTDLIRNLGSAVRPADRIK